MNLRAHNLMIFLQMADGVDDSWLHHLKQGDDVRWFREAIKDDELASEAAAIQGRRPPTRAATREMVERRSTVPAES